MIKLERLKSRNVRVGDPMDYVGLSEIAERADVLPSAVSNWLKRYSNVDCGNGCDAHCPKQFPDPLINLPRRKIWNWEDVVEWLRETNRI